MPFPSPMNERKSESEVAQLSPTLSDPVDCSLPGSSVHGIFQARVLEWVANAFSGHDAYKRANLTSEIIEILLTSENNLSIFRPRSSS